MTNSTIVGNGADVGGGLWLLGGTNVIVGCTISGNWGGAWIEQSGVLSLVNCTVSENAVNRGGIHGGDIYMDHCTIAFNTNWYGRPEGSGVSGSVYSRNSIFAGNGNEDISGVLASGGYNLIQNTNGATITGDQTGNIYGVDPLLGSLQDNGGPTWTHALPFGSGP